MERSDIMKYECLRKKMKVVRCNAKKLLQSDDISIDEMRTIIRNLNQISRKMKEMSKKLGTKRFMIDDLVDSDASNHSGISIKKEKRKFMEPLSADEMAVSCKAMKQKLSSNRGETKCVSRSRIAEIFSDEDCATQSDQRPKEGYNSKGSYISKSSKSIENQHHSKSDPRYKEADNYKERYVAKSSKSIENQHHTKSEPRSKEADNIDGYYSWKSSNSIENQHHSQSDPRPKEANDFKGSYITKYSKSNDHQHHCYDGLVVETCSKCLCRRWSIPSVNRSSLKTYIKKNIKSTGHRAPVNNIKDCDHSFCQVHPLDRKDDYVPLPGLVPHERKHLTAVRNKILKENACNNVKGLSNKNSSAGCCFNSNSDLEVFETSDTSLNKSEDPFGSCDNIFDPYSSKYKGGTIHFDGENSQVSSRPNMTKIKSGISREAAGVQDESVINAKYQSNEKVTNTKKLTKMLDKCIQSACPKVNQCTSYDNFVLHPQFSWSMPMIGQAFRRSIPLDKCGKFLRPSKPSTDIGTTTKKPKHLLVMDRSVQTNDMLFTNSMHQVMYLNVVYTKTHLRYIIPNSMEIPVLPQTPKVIERRAIDKGYAVTTYKADPDGVIHFTLAYSDGGGCGTEGSGTALPSEDNRRLCQLKNLWISSARKFFSQINEKLVGESGDCDERHLWSSSTGLNCSSAYTSSSVTQSETSDTSSKTNCTEY
ncbi:uncharacterized protein [Halyomorpha halys]|nr:uncharacterized protein LOC106684954 isoform X2 [Halyomorpha halys]